ncbi:MAG: tetratricopeptide repeat protein [Parafilimonas sp.]
MAIDNSTTNNSYNADINTNVISAETLEKITKNLSNTLWLGLVTGLIGIVGYPFTVNGGWRLFFLFILIAAASYIIGFFLGFLFGIPKRVSDNQMAYNLNTNLVDISDWLTKIIIGLGLVEIKTIPGYLESIGAYIQKAVNGDDSIKIFSVCAIVYFSIFGLYYGYNYMRLFLSGQFKEADDNLLKKEEQLSMKGEELKQQNLAPDNMDAFASKKINEYNQLLKTTKTESDYTFDDWYYKGIEAYNKQDYNKTIVYMKNALEKDLKCLNAPDAFLYEGLAYYNLGLYDKAIDANNSVINNYPNYPSLYLAHYNNGVYLSQIQQHDKAIEEYKASLQLNDTYTNSWNNKGYEAIYLQLYDDAVDALSKAITLEPANANAWFNRACAYSLKNDRQNMLDNLSRAIQLNPTFKAQAKTSSWLQNFKDDDDFKRIVE